jgi:hypothetical protein
MLAQFWYSSRHVAGAVLRTLVELLEQRWGNEAANDSRYANTKPIF